MVFDGAHHPDTVYVANVSRGKDSTAMLLAIKELGWPLDKIVSVDVWATHDIPAEIPPMVEFKNDWDKKCLALTGVPVTRICAMRDGEKLSYEDVFYRVRKCGGIYGFPIVRGPWCNGFLKRDLLDGKSVNGSAKNVVSYIGIAADEKKRIERWQQREGKALPLVQIGWDEVTCRKIAEDLDMLAPIYKTGERDGCWFCHNQSVNQMRRLRKEYPHLWEKLMQWDDDSPLTFKPNGRTVHDYDRRFQLEDEGFIDQNERFKWEHCQFPCRQMTIYDFLEGTQPRKEM